MSHAEAIITILELKLGFQHRKLEALKLAQDLERMEPANDSADPLTALVVLGGLISVLTALAGMVS